MLPASLTVAGIYELAVWSGAARVFTGVIALDVSYRAFKNLAEIYNAKKADLRCRKWTEFAHNALTAAAFGFCAYKNVPTVALVGIIFYGVYAVCQGAKDDAYLTARYIKRTLEGVYRYVPTVLKPL